MVLQHRTRYPEEWGRDTCLDCGCVSLKPWYSTCFLNIYKQEKPCLTLPGKFHPLGLQTGPKVLYFFCVKTMMLCSTFEWSAISNTGECILRLVLVGCFSFFLVVFHLRWLSSTMTTSVSVSISYSAINCLDFEIKSMPLTLERYFAKSFAPIRIQSFLTRRAKS